MKRALNLPIFGSPSFGILVFGIPDWLWSLCFGERPIVGLNLPTFGVPSSHCQNPCFWNSHLRRSGSEKGVFWKRGPFRKGHFLEFLENLEILETLENPQTLENKGESDHFLEILENLENLEILEILEIPPAKRPLS